jgi:DNA-binding NarL/FixJ family response regulator
MVNNPQIVESNRRHVKPAVFLFNRVGKVILHSFISTYGYGETMTTVSELTPREREILQLVMAGYTNKAIALEIFVSEKTVEFHLDNIYTKIGVRTRLLAGIWAIEHGIEILTRETPS